MYTSSEIADVSNRLKEKYGTDNPFALARALRIELMVRPLGSIKGFYKMIYRNAFIFLNRDLGRREARLVLAHDIGHHLLHKEFAAFGFEEASLFSPVGRREYEANLFAAELLISNEAIRDLAAENYTIDQMARILHMDESFVQLKLDRFLGKN